LEATDSGMFGIESMDEPVLVPKPISPTRAHMCLPEDFNRTLTASPVGGQPVAHFFTASHSSAEPFVSASFEIFSGGLGHVQPDFADSSGPLQPLGGAGHEPDFADSPGPMQPLGGAGPEPEFGDDFFGEVGQRTASDEGPETRTQARGQDIDNELDDIPIEDHRMSTFSSKSPGSLPTREPRNGTSARRKEYVCQQLESLRPSGVTRRRASQAAHHIWAETATPARGDKFVDGELPLDMPKLPFASRHLVDPIIAAPKFQSHGGYSRWLNRGIPGDPRTAAEASRVPSPRQPWRAGRPAEDDDMAWFHVGEGVAIEEDDDRDSFSHEFEGDSPRTLVCGSTPCRFEPCAGSSARDQPPPGARKLDEGLPDDVVNSLGEFISGADDAVLSYILNQADQQKASTSRRLEPGTLLPGQHAGCPLPL